MGMGMGMTVMPGRNAIAAIALLAALNMAMAGAGATDVSKYPDIRAQWNRIGSAQFDPAKGAALAQEVPFTPEYQAIFDRILADRAAGGLENNWTAACLPAGMPRAMIGYEPLDFVVTPDITYIKLSYMQELR